MKIDERIPRDVYRKIMERDRFNRFHYMHRIYPFFSRQGKNLSLEVVVVKTMPAKRKKDRSHLWMKKVAVFIIGKNKCYFRDIDLMEYCYAFYRYRYCFYRSDMPKSNRLVIKNHYSDSQWHEGDIEYFRLYNKTRFINPEYLQKWPEYKYCAYDETADAFDYLNAYRKNPKIELIAKLLNCQYAKAPCINKKAEKDKNFLLFLRDNATYIKVYRPASNDICAAYNKKISIAEQTQESNMRRNFHTTFWRRHYLQDDDLAYIQYRDLDKKGRTKMIRYLIRNKINPESYKDYLIALRKLNIDMTDTKNLYPLDWQYWHDVRMNQYATAVANEKRTAKAALTRRIKAKAKEYAALLMQDVDFHIKLATCKKDLVKEGEALHHCVGRMDYDQRIANGKSLVCFVRRATEPDVPFVTIEYSLEKNQVVQCYGVGDSKPSDDVMHFVDNVWQPKAKSIIQKMRKATEQKAA